MILVTGCPRSGTAFYAAYMRSQGLDIGHETMGKDGIASWYLAANVDWRLYENATGITVPVKELTVPVTRRIHLVRNPMDTIASIAYTMHETSLRWLQSWFGLEGRSAPEIAARFWVLWNFKAEFLATKRVRVEDVPALDLPRNDRFHPVLDLADFHDARLIQTLRRSADRYGYEVK